MKGFKKKKRDSSPMCGNLDLTFFENATFGSLASSGKSVTPFQVINSGKRIENTQTQNQENIRVVKLQ